MLTRIEIVGATLAGLAVILNALFISRRAIEHATQNDNELYSTAIQYLGNESKSTRLGGIYALYELAENKKYTKSVHEILCSHIRSKTNEKEYQKIYKKTPSIEIESLLKLLTSKEDCERFSGLEINLREAQLQGAKLHGAKLDWANLGEAQLDWANLDEAQLRGASLDWAQLPGASLNKAQLRGANLSMAQLDWANLSMAQLQGASLDWAQLQGASLRQTQMQGADLRLAQMQGANLGEAQLQGALLGWAQLQGANLGEAQLQGADLHNTKLQGAYLHNTQLQGANLGEAQLQGTFSKTEILDDPRWEEQIRIRADQETELNTVTFSGDISTVSYDNISQSVNLEDKLWKQTMKGQLKDMLDDLKQNHVDHDAVQGSDKNARDEYLKNSIVGAYTEAYAEQLIKEYKAVTSDE